MKRVCYIFPVAHHYRLPFHERLRALLAVHDIDYRVVYSEPGAENIRKKDTVEIPWGVKVRHTRLPCGLEYQHGLREALKSDLVIVQQENSLALNYLLSLASMLNLKKVAFFGHGRNFQSRAPNGAAERFKRFWATKVNWWFGYTDETRQHIESLGFPPEKITVFNNTVDTTDVRAAIAAVTPERTLMRLADLELSGEHVGVFVGGLYPDKRIEFLVDAGDRVRAIISDFELLVVGGGDHLPLIRELATTRPWIKVTGPRFGTDKIELMTLGQMFLMPGLVGLAILDAGAAGLPTVTTGFPWHSPEIAYLDDGVNGVIVAEWEDPQAYADAIVALFEDQPRLAAMRASVEFTARGRTIEAMAERFAEGVLKALE